MSETDPFDRIDGFDPGPSRGPLPASEVRHRGDRLRRRHTLAVSFAGVAAVLALVIPVAVIAGGDDRAEPVPAAPGRSETQAAGQIPFGRFPLDQGWGAVYGKSAVNGPDPGAGGISMPEGHCEDDVLFNSGYEDKLSAYVVEGESSLTREILGYRDAASAGATLQALREAVGSCGRFDDATAGRAAYSTRVYDALDEANAEGGYTTFSFAYTSNDGAPFGILYQFAVVDDVLYGSSEYGEWTARSATQGISALDAGNEPLIALLPDVQRRPQHRDGPT